MNIALLKAAMERKRYTVNSLANEMGLSYHTVRNWRKGRTSPNWLNASELCEILDVRYDELMGDQVAPATKPKATMAKDETIDRLNNVIQLLASGCRHTTAICHIAAIIQDMGGDL